MVTKPEGWRNKRPDDPKRHSDASRGIKSGTSAKVGKPIYDRGKWKQAKLPSMEGADEILAHDALLFEQNTRELRQWQGQAFQKFYTRLRKRGKYDHDLAVQGIMNNYVPNIMKKYNQENGCNLKADKATARLIAEGWVKEFEAESEFGNYDHLLKKN
jgi:hypothetical protein